ncbi:MAG TPA: translation elongation factor Ts [Dehalococcoidia bacterium]|nr:translation elongation factor Ts [Dehalococcoidia bacterium]
MVSTDDVRRLREMTGAGIMDCKRALDETKGDFEKAVEVLRQKGLAQAAKRAERATEQGLVEAYIHTGGRVGALVELLCETDFVARTDEFKELAHDIALQVTATAPAAISEDEDGVREMEPGELVLLKQPFIRDQSKTIEDLIREAIAKTGENIKIRKVARFEVGR